MASEESDFTRKVLALALGALAAKLAIVAMEQLWTKGLRKELPAEDDDRVWQRVIWIGLTAAAVGMARELAREAATRSRKA